MLEISTRDFLTALYPHLGGVDGPPGELVVWTLPAKTSHWCDSLDAAAEKAQRQRDHQDVYFGVALQNRDRALDVARRRRRPSSVGTAATVPLAGVRGFETSATAIPGVWIDIDVAGDGHRSRDLPATPAQALALVDRFPLGPTLIVASGGGFHVYWLFAKPWILRNARDRARAAALVRKVQHVIRELAADHGWKIDGTADLTRVLRLPGTFNHKGGHRRPVTVQTFHPDRRYEPSAFDILPDPPPALATPAAASTELPALGSAPLPGAPQPGTPQPGTPQPGTPQPGTPQPGTPQPGAPQPGAPPQEGHPTADYDAVMAGCSWLRACHRDQHQLDEPQWYAALSIVGRCAAGERDGRELAHDLSRGYPRYSPAETDTKLRRALTEAGPRTCGNIGQVLGAWREHCARCSHQGLLKTPWELGRPRSCRPRILVDHREDRVCDQALAALAAGEPELFQRGGLLVQVAPAEDAATDPQAAPLLHRPPAGPRVREVSEPRLRELLAKRCAFVVPKAVRGGRELKAAHPPAWAVRELLSRPSWPGIPRLEGLVEGPVLRPDASVLQHPGYDPASGLYAAPRARFDPVSDSPSTGAVEEALLRLREAVCDFPFREEAHFSAWLASLLTPLARFAFRGPAPLYVIDANVRGAGKSLLVDVCHIIVTGRPAPRMPYSRDESELRKSITAIALSGAQMVLIDNVAGVLGSAVLDLVLTGATWSDRLLGANTRLELPLCATWYVTGNNLVLGEDTPRRAIHIRLESPEEKPEERTGFRHPDLLRWVESERARLLPAALTLLAAYRAAGRPRVALLPMGSYEGWSELVRATLVWLDLPDPALTREALPTTADSELATCRSLVLGLEDLLAELGGVATAKEILTHLASEGNAFRFEGLRSALEDLFPRLATGELPTPVQLGMKLRKVHGRVVEGAAIVQAPRSPKGARWTVQRRGEGKPS